MGAIEDSQIVHLGLGEHDRIDRIQVLCPDSSETIFEDIAASRRLVVTPDDEWDPRSALGMTSVRYA